MRFLGDMSDRSTVKLLPNGQRDLSFPTFPQTTGGGVITPWVDGKFYVGTTTVRRLLPNGLLDPSFIAPHTSPYFQGGSGGGGDYHVFSDGRVLLSGLHLLSDSIRAFEGQYNLIWFSNEGYLDTTRMHRKGNGAVNRFIELPNGQFICSSTCTEFEGQPVDWIFRVNADGSPDTTFRTGVFIGGARTYLPLPDGRVYVGGNFRRTEAPNDTLRLVRFMPDGSLDPTFTIPQFTMGGGGITAPFGAYVHRILSWSSGYLLVAGQFGNVNGEPRSSICMIDSTGQVHPAFSGNWLGSFTNGSITNSAIADMLPNEDNTALYICGAYVGYGDGMANDPQQRFVSRLLVSELTVGLAESEVPKFSVQPNPVAQGGTVQVVLQLPGNSTTQGTMRLSVVGSDGRLVHEQAVQGDSYQMMNIPFSAGLYHLHLSDADRWIATMKLVVE